MSMYPKDLDLIKIRASFAYRNVFRSDFIAISNAPNNTICLNISIVCLSTSLCVLRRSKLSTCSEKMSAPCAYKLIKIRLFPYQFH